MIGIEYIIGLVLAITEVIKRKTNIDDKLSGIIAVFLGAGLNMLNAFAFGGDLREAFGAGFIAAFIASGVFSVAKNTTQYIKQKR